MYLDRKTPRKKPPTQLTVRRNWMPLFFWMLDSCIINAYLVSRERLQHTAQKKVDVQRNQRLFRLRLAWNLVLEGSQELFGESNRTFNAVRAKVLRARGRGVARESRLNRGTYIKPTMSLPDARLALGVDHLPVHINEKRARRWCNYCAWRRNHGETDWISKKTSFKCFVCEWALCCDCFSLFHADTPSFDQSNRFTNTYGQPWVGRANR